MSEQIEKCVDRATPNWVKERDQYAALDTANKVTLTASIIVLVGLLLIQVTP